MAANMNSPSNSLTGEDLDYSKAWVASVEAKTIHDSLEDEITAIAREVTRMILSFRAKTNKLASVQAYGVKDAVHAMCNLTETLMSKLEPLRSARINYVEAEVDRVKAKCRQDFVGLNDAGSMATGTTMVPTETASKLNRILDEIEGVKRLVKERERAADAWPKIQKEAAVQKETAEEPHFQVVKGKKARQEKSMPKLAAKKKSPAVLVEVGNRSFSEVLRKIREEPTLKDMPDILSMRRTNAGDLLVEVGKKSKGLDNIAAAIKSAVGDSPVRTMQQTARMGIFGLDELATVEEVTQAVSTAVEEAGEIKVALVKQDRGLQLAIVSARPEVISRILSLGRLKIGYVSCRVRLWQETKRCFKCMGSGHESRECKNADRSKCCRKCGLADHFAKDCSADGATREGFRQVLRQEALGANSAQ